MKEGKGTLVGNSGEYFVVAELLKQGIVATLTPRNAPDLPPFSWTLQIS